MTRMMPLRYLQRGCFAATAIVVSLLAAEVFLDGLPGRNPVDLRDIIVWDVPYGYRFLPNSSKTIHGVKNDFTTKININSFGFRFPETTVNRDQNIHRLALLGDSEAFGVGVEAEQTLSSVMQGMLNQVATNRFEVLNFALPVAGAKTEAEVLRCEVVKWKPDVVIVVMNENDIFDKVYLRTKGITPESPHAIIAWAESFSVVQLFKSGLARLAHSAFPRRAGSSLTPQFIGTWYMNKRLDQDFASMSDAVSDIIRICDKNGVRTVVTMLPGPWQYDNVWIQRTWKLMDEKMKLLVASDPWRPQRMMDSFAHERGINYVHTHEHLAELSNSNQVALVYRRDGHLNARGNRELAKMLVSSVLDSSGDLLPPDSRGVAQETGD